MSVMNKKQGKKGNFAEENLFSSMAQGQSLLAFLERRSVFSSPKADKRQYHFDTLVIFLDLVASEGESYIRETFLCNAPPSLLFIQNYKSNKMP